MTLNGTAIKTWSTMQPTIALSSGEAEMTAFVKAASEGTGVQSLAREMCPELSLVVVVDSLAAVGMVNRSGVGRVRHLDVKDLWVQERVKRGFFSQSSECLVTRISLMSRPSPWQWQSLQDKISLVNAHIVARKPRWADMSE